ncbi:AMP-binding protein, partial [Paraglaciecola polaris]|uniref:AMP-binding protein n=1 Tax=Paraglaciecola polaris TaxID=222814 RepID=UPI0009FCD76D
KSLLLPFPCTIFLSLTVNFLIYAGCGSHNILITNPRDMDGFISTIKESGFTLITGVNTLYVGMMTHPDFVNIDFSNLQATINGGTAAMEATSEKWQAITGLPIIQGYGLSETSPILTWTQASERTFTGKIGRAFPNTEIKLLDDEDNEVPMGERGELVAKGPQVTKGYYQQPEISAAAFTSDGYFRTGDIAIVDAEGNFQIVDRKKDMVIVSGFNVYPNDVEQVAAKCDGVVECACLGVPDEKTGEAVKLFAVKAPGSKVTEADIIAYCRAHLTPYKVPKSVVFIDEVPKSAVGKMLRRVLRDA